MAPEWADRTIWWQVYPLGFVGAPTVCDPAEQVVHRLTRLGDWLDYAAELGASGIALGPVFAAETHGYDTADYFAVDPRLGDDDDFDALVVAAHQRGLRVLLDGVFNHVGRSFAAFRRAVSQGPESPTASWFRLDWAPGWVVGDPEPAAANFEGHGQLVALNHDEPAVAELVVEVMNHWLDRGADGWRLDAAYAVPTGFWATVLPRVRAGHPDVYVVGEVIHGDYAAIVGESGMDAVTQYELWKAVWGSFNDANLFELAWALKRHDEFLDVFAPLTFIGNHDVTRIAAKLTDPRHLAHALAVLMTVGGTPSIYYGDEQGFRGVKEDRVGGDDAIRPAFPSTPDQLSDAGSETWQLHRTLIALRNARPWLSKARVTTLELTNTAFSYRAAPLDGTPAEQVVVALNLADTPVTVSITGPAAEAGPAGEAHSGEGSAGSAGPAEVLAGAATFVPDAVGSVRLAGHGWVVLAPA